MNSACHLLDRVRARGGIFLPTHLDLRIGDRSAGSGSFRQTLDHYKAWAAWVTFKLKDKTGIPHPWNGNKGHCFRGVRNGRGYFSDNSRP